MVCSFHAKNGEDPSDCRLHGQNGVMDIYTCYIVNFCWDPVQNIADIIAVGKRSILTNFAGIQYKILQITLLLVRDPYKIIFFICEGCITQGPRTTIRSPE